MSLVAIQALTAELTKKEQEIKSLKEEKDAEISELKDRLARIEALLLDQK